MKLLAALLAFALLCGDAWAQAIPPANTGMTWVPVTCGATSTPFGVNGGQYLSIQVPPTATQTVWFAWNGNAAVVGVPSQGYVANSNIQWGGGTGSCIVASGTQAISVGYK